MAAAIRLIVSLWIVLLVGCAMDGRKRVTVVNPASNPLDQVLVIPLYYNSFGVGLVPDSQGPRTAPKAVVMRPFLLDSGEDLMAKKVATRGVIVPVPPIVYVGTSHYVRRWLLLKHRFSPLVLDDTIGVWGDKPIVMTPSARDEVSPCLEKLLAGKPDQDAIKGMLNASSMTEEVEVHLHPEDRALVRNYGGWP